MRILIAILRILVGVLFIFSGLVKANDPLGLSYKMQEFFEVWGTEFLNPYTLVFSVSMIAFEIIAGVAVLLGWQMRLFSWLLLLLIVFFTFLTGYAVLSGKVRQCGCFGDCIPLDAWQSFIKDLLLLGMILVIFRYKNTIRSLIQPSGSIAALFFSGIFSIAFMWHVLHHLPLVDCLPYKKGVPIMGAMKIPEGATPDSTVITFVYNHAGKEIEFTMDKFPADFNDSTYTFIKRYDKLVREGNAKPAINDFSLTNRQGEPVTETILLAEGYKLLLFVKEGYPEGEWKDIAQLIAQQAYNTGIARVLVTSSALDKLYTNPPPAFYRFEPVLCDAVAIKTAARTNPTLYLLKKDTIIEKWAYTDLEDALKYIRNLNK